MRDFLCLLAASCAAACVSEPTPLESGQAALDGPWCDPAVHQVLKGAALLAAQSGAPSSSWGRQVFDGLNELGAVRGRYAPDRVTLTAPAAGTSPGVWRITIVTGLPEAALAQIDAWVDAGDFSIRSIRGVNGANLVGHLLGAALCDRREPEPRSCDAELHALCAELDRSCTAARTACAQVGSLYSWADAEACGEATGTCEAFFRCGLARDSVGTTE